jgi:hypothetical protein
LAALSRFLQRSSIPRLVQGNPDVKAALRLLGELTAEPGAPEANQSAGDLKTETVTAMAALTERLQALPRGQRALPIRELPRGEEAQGNQRALNLGRFALHPFQFRKSRLTRLVLGIQLNGFFVILNGKWFVPCFRISLAQAVVSIPRFRE